MVLHSMPRIYKSGGRSLRNRPRYAQTQKRGMIYVERPSGPPPRSTYGGGPRTGGFLGIETKFIDYTYEEAIVNTVTGAEADPPGPGAQTAPGCISAIAQGDGESNRDGRKCTLTSIHLRGSVILDPRSDTSTSVGGTTVRVLVVQDTQTNGAQLNSEDVILAATNVEHSFRNLQFTKRFKILKDQTFAMKYPSASGTSVTNDVNGDIKNFKWNFKVNIPVIHKANTAVIASITDNSIHVIAFCSQNGVATLNYNARCRFVG